MVAATASFAPSLRVRQGAWVVPVAVLAILLQSWSSLDCDVSWLITVAERVSDGAMLYRDVEEVNPPASILLYMPFVAVARAVGMRVEPVTVGLCILLVALSLIQAGRLLDRSVRMSGGLVAYAAFVLLVLPADLFAQREHIALAAGLPMLALMVARADGRSISRADACIAGCSAGLMIAIKPHLALSLLPVAAWLVVQRSSFKNALGVEWTALALTCVGYAAVVLFAFPQYLQHMLPLLRLVYLPARNTWANLLTGPVVVIPAAAAIITFWLSRGSPSKPSTVALLAAGGFVLAALVQGKGYLNHGYPGVAMALLAVALELTRPGKARALGWSCGCILALTSTYGYARVPELHALRDAVVRVGPPHPRLIGVSFNFALGHPLTRWIDGRWVGRRGSLWATGGARQQLEQRSLPPERCAAFRQVEEDDARMLAADIVAQTPDIVLVDDHPGLAFITAHPALAAAMAAYHPAARVESVTLWTRHAAP
ncbi:hypothetical protein [Sphingomonas endolithica]|uniref:hypothetical protein n=1 Tax=Sphingomonas endolithica TaxID=2972485 RepID=UPI0021AF235F|nr:hypothetical protein [Sphingomonas sp. ZFBP2030]